MYATDKKIISWFMIWNEELVQYQDESILQNYFYLWTRKYSKT